MKKIVDGLITHHDDRDIPVILFTKGGGPGWRLWPKPVVTGWVSTGLWI